MGPHETLDRQPRAVPVTPDSRVKALVLLAPATPWFRTPSALRDVRVPILMLTAGKDEHTPEWHAEIVKRGVASVTPITHRVVANAGHYSFLSPFPAAMSSPAFPPSQDPLGLIAFAPRGVEFRGGGEGSCGASCDRANELYVRNRRACWLTNR